MTHSYYSKPYPCRKVKCFNAFYCYVISVAYSTMVWGHKRRQSTALQRSFWSESHRKSGAGQYASWSAEIKGQEMLPLADRQSSTRVLRTDSMQRRSSSFSRTSTSLCSARPLASWQ
jgi:hypothetical protein